MKPAGFLFHGFAVVTVTLWMLLAASWLFVRGKLPFGLVWQTCRATFRRRYRGRLGEFRAENGHCHIATLSAKLPSDADIGSSLVVFEDGVALAHGHAAHDEIRQLGRGRYSHWAGNLYFATSDNSDPRTNGRIYTVAER